MNRSLSRTHMPRARPTPLRATSILFVISAAIASPALGDVERYDFYIPASPTQTRDPFRCSVEKAQQGCVISSNSYDKLVVAWLTEPVAPHDSTSNIYYRTVVTSGTPHWSRATRIHDEFYADTSAESEGIRSFRFHPSVAMSPSGQWLCAWEEMDSLPVTEPSRFTVRVVARRFNADDSTASPIFLVDETPGLLTAPVPANPTCGIAAPGSNGPNQVIVWQRLGPPQMGEIIYDSDESSARMLAVVYRWDGSRLIGRARVEPVLFPGPGCTAFRPGSNPSVSMNADSNFCVSYDGAFCAQGNLAEGLRAFQVIDATPPMLDKSNTIYPLLKQTSVSLNSGRVVGEYAIPNMTNVIGAGRFDFSVSFGGMGNVVIAPVTTPFGSLNASTCYNQEFPSITTYPSSRRQTCVHDIAWHAPGHDCNTNCAADRDVFAARDTQCECDTDDVTVNAFGVVFHSK